MKQLIAFLLTATAVTLTGCKSAPRQVTGSELKWHTIVEERFADSSSVTAKDNIRTDAALEMSVRDGDGIIAGVASDKKWEGDYWSLPIPPHTNDLLEISADFRIADADGYALVALWGTGEFATQGPGAMCMFFQGEKDNGGYFIQQSHFRCPSKLVSGKKHQRGLGDESARFHNMKMVLDRAQAQIQYYVDDRLLGVVQFEGSIGPVKMLRIGVQAPDRGRLLDIRCDNLLVRVANEI